MSNVRFVKATQNAGRKSLAASTYPKLINGNGAYTGNLALVQDAAFPMANVLVPDRVSRLWVCPPGLPNIGGVDVAIDLDIAASPVSIMAAGVHGFGLLGNGAFPSTCGMEYLPGTTYSASGWVQLPTFSLGGTRDPWQIFAAPISARFWRFRFYFGSSSGFTVASFMLARSITDLGFLYSGADETLVRPRAIVEGYGRMPIVKSVGLKSRRFSLEYQNIDPATRNVFDGLLDEANPFAYLSPEDRMFECIPEADEFTRRHAWAPPDRHNFTFAMRSMP